MKCFPFAFCLSVISFLMKALAMLVIIILWTGAFQLAGWFADVEGYLLDAHPFAWANIPRSIITAIVMSLLGINILLRLKQSLSVRDKLKGNNFFLMGREYGHVSSHNNRVFNMPLSCSLR